MPVFIGASLLFAASAAATVAWCGSMSRIGGMPMPGGWMMSMAWMRMPGQSWPGAATSFLGMWTVMMVAMMLPSLFPSLWRDRLAFGPTGDLRSAGHTALVGAGYFFVWTALGVVVFPLGIALTSFEMQQPALARAIPVASAFTVLVAGVLQCTAWKRRNLACCREEDKHRDARSTGVATAWQHGVRLGINCVPCCANLMAILLAVGVMDLRAMAVVTAAITVERLAPAGKLVTRSIGVVAIAAGVILVARSVIG